MSVKERSDVLLYLISHKEETLFGSKSDHIFYTLSVLNLTWKKR